MEPHSKSLIINNYYYLLFSVNPLQDPDQLLCLQQNLIRLISGELSYCGGAIAQQIPSLVELPPHIPPPQPLLPEKTDVSNAFYTERKRIRSCNLERVLE